MTPLAAYLLLFVAVGVGFILVHLVLGKLIRPANPDAEKDTIYECGEPTIGSAWVQFDLRYYVVALLFVVFDVEVAFFFPWAEVFGKANAVANAKKPETAEQYREYAKKMLDLAAPASADSFAKAEIERYKKIAELDQQGLDDLREKQKVVNESNTAANKVKQAESAVSEKVREKRELSADEKKIYAAYLVKRKAAAELELIDRKLAARQKLTPAEKTIVDKANLVRAEEREISIIFNQEGGMRKGEFDKNRASAYDLARIALVEVLVFFGVLLVGFAYLWRRGDLQWVRSTAAEAAETKAREELVGAGQPK